MEYPCKECTTVPDPKCCDRKKCAEWKSWFLDRWKKINNFYENYMKDKEKEDG